MKPQLVGVIHLPALPGSPNHSLPMSDILAGVRADAECLQHAGFDAVVVENFGDAPFFKDNVPKVTVAAMTAACLAAREAAPSLALVVNVLRNDADAALAVAAVSDAVAIRVNIHTGARVADQGLIEGRAADTLRTRKALGLRASIWADVDVKHSAALAPYPLDQDVHDLVLRGGAEVVIASGSGTGVLPDEAKLRAISELVRGCGARVGLGSGASLATLPMLAKYIDVLIVGSALREGGKAGGGIAAQRAQEFSAAFRAAFLT